MNGFTDIHTHILPEIDDGAKDMTQALKLLRLAWEDGTRTVFLTPHYRGKFKQHTPNVLREAFEWLCEMTKQELPGMKLYLGQEIAYEADIPETMRQGGVLALHGSRYVLLEFRANALRSQLITGVAETVRCGFIPIVAHIERYDIARMDPTLVDEVLSMGALLQLNADSVCGKNGFRIKRFCHQLLAAEKVHFIASDAHDITHRPPLLRQSFLTVHRKYGKEYATRLFYENARTVIEDQFVE